jgi:hypothetical protein
MALTTESMRPASKIEFDVDDFGSFSTPLGCPSATSSFLATDTSPREPASYRRQSVASSTISSGRDLFSSTSGSTVGPSTPLSAEYMNIVPSGDSMMCVPNDLNLQGAYGGWKNAGHGVDSMWTAPESKYPNSTSFLDYSSIDILEAQDVFNDSSSSNDWHLLSTSAANLSFSRGILDEQQMSPDNFSTGSIGQWIPTMAYTPPETVAPSATFQATLASSPCKLEPMTPLRYPAPAPASILSSSPYPLYSPGQLSIREEYELAEQIIEAIPMTAKHVNKARRGGNRTTHPAYERKCLGTSSRMKSAVSKSGMTCDVIIEGNKYACEFADCIDKNGRRKMFKRREHAKRHVDTVHLKKKQFRCWVPGCATQPFTRSDNLTTHLKSTHGKKSVSSRNRYVSTLDPASENFDPEWRGDLDDDGYPVDDRGVVLK